MSIAQELLDALADEKDALRARIAELKAAGTEVANAIRGLEGEAIPYGKAMALSNAIKRIDAAMKLEK